MIHQALFPFRQYSLPIAKKIGIPGAAYLQLIMEKYGEAEFSLSVSDQQSIGCYDLSGQTSLITNNVIIRSGENWKVNNEKFEELVHIEFQSDPRSRNKELMASINAFIKSARIKGKHLRAEEILSSTEDYSDEDLIATLNYSRDNGYVRLFRQVAKKHISRDGQKCPGVGDLTSSDQNRDYSQILGEASEIA